MPRSLNLLLLEDSPNDAELILDVLREAGFELASRRVDSQADYLRELDQPPDFILSDFSMPQFHGARCVATHARARARYSVHCRVGLHR